MESKRLGLCQKPLFVVPNHLTEQWASEFIRLYPSASILVATKKDFERANRQKFCARIATGDYDAVIIGHSQFERIPVSQERQQRLLREQLDDITHGIEELKYQRGEQFSIKQLERTRKQLENRLSKLEAEERKDDVVTFEQLGGGQTLCGRGAFIQKFIFVYKNAERRRAFADGIAEIIGYVPEMPIHGRNHRRQGHCVCNGYARQQQHDGAVHHAALPVVRHIAAEKHVAF